MNPTALPSGATGLEGFSELDVQFARLLHELAPGSGPELVLAAALTSRRRSEGHTCLLLPSVAGRPLHECGIETVDDAEPTRLPALGEWIAALKASGIVGTPGEFAPLILDAANRLYLHRYWTHEQNLATALRKRIAHRLRLPAPARDGAMESILERLFPRTGSDPDWQKIAAWMALTRPLTVITGGPGTGKTRTVVWLLAALLEAHDPQPLDIAVCAPTGKAAARIAESIDRARRDLPCSDALKARLPAAATTLHRLLGSIPNSPAFRHNADNPLPADVVVVDEASMVDLALMTRLVQALRPGARLILVGDKDQLASVEAGNVLGELCGRTESRRYSAPFAAEARAVTSAELPAAEVDESCSSPGLADCIVELRRNWRFGAAAGLSELSRAVNAGQAGEALRILTNTPGAWHPLPAAAHLRSELRGPILAAYGPLTRQRDPAVALKAVEQFRILAVVRKGPYGVESLNALCEVLLREAGFISGTVHAGGWYPGRPVLITRNEPELRLFNGDIGICLPDFNGELRVYFPDGSGGIRALMPARLPEHETVYAMTVHKSQGSELDRVLMILPERDTPLLTRELIYTGITRARSGVEAWSDPGLLRTAIERRVERASGLNEALWTRAARGS
jgi:exodeoxyribonuclease V alpha subunit